jgi:prolyl-tRNA synthetase
VVEQAHEDDLARVPSLVKGYIGPQILADAKIGYLVDPLVVEGTAWVTGANELDRHAAFVVRGRDFEPDGEIGAVEIRDGDRCARCGSPLEIARGIELGHVFQLGRKYAEALELKVLDENGKLVTVTMGSYGIGVTRAVAAIAEDTLDEIGLCWPRHVAPADVHVVAAGKDEAVFAAAEELVAGLTAAGLDVIYDDRAGKISPGVKFKDAELIGVPTIVTVGRGVADPDNRVIEIKDRRTGERQEVALDDAVTALTAIVRG